MIDPSLRPLSVSEFSTFDLNTRVPSLCLIPDLSPNMLSFAITIGPDEQSFASFGLFFNVLCDCYFILQVEFSYSKAPPW